VAVGHAVAVQQLLRARIAILLSEQRLIIRKLQAGQHLNGLNAQLAAPAPIPCKFH
jgi:hypothetical protein